MRHARATRLAGIKRMGEIVSASSRVAEDGRTYYDLSIRMASYASRNPYASTQKEVRASADAGQRAQEGQGGARAGVGGAPLATSHPAPPQEVPVAGGMAALQMAGAPTGGGEDGG